MQNIDRVEGDNLGGNYEDFYFCPKNDITSIPKQTAGRILDSIVHVTDKKFFKAEAIIETVGGGMVQKRDRNGVYYEQSLRALVKGDTAVLTALFMEMVYYEYIVIRRDINDFYKIMGSLKEPLEFNYELLPGQERQNLKSYVISFARRTKFPEYFYEGTLATYDGTVQSASDLELLSCATLNDEDTGITDTQVSNCLIPSRAVEVTEDGINNSNFMGELYNKAALYMQNCGYQFF